MSQENTGGGDGGSEAEDSLAATVEMLPSSPTMGLGDTIASPLSQTLAGPAAGDGEPLERGDLVDRYVILDRLGAGGMGVVYAAYDPELDRKVALKLLHLVDDVASGSGRTRLVREAQALAKLNHPNVVTVHDVGTLGGQVWLAMEYVDGQTLSAWRRERRPPWQDVLEVMLDAGRGLAAAHRAGLIHRDVKPDNIMVGRDGRVRMMDFGLARADGEVEVETDGAPVPSTVTSGELAVLSLRITQVGSMLGTPTYMSPESLRGAEADARSDLFGFCATLWEGLYGDVPFAGANFSELCDSVFAGQLRPVPRGSPVPRWVRRGCERGLATKPGDRFASMDELLAYFERGRGRGRRRRVALGIAALAVAIGGVAGWRAYEREAKETACVAAGAAIDEVWNDDAAVRLRRGLLDTGAANADDTYARMLPWIDRWTASWSATTTTICRSAELDGAWTPALYERAKACLGEQRDALSGLLEGLSDIPPASIWYAVPIAAGLPRVEGCGERSLLRQRPAPPDEAVRERAWELRRRLMVVIGLHEAGRYSEAMALAEALLAEAEAVDYAPLEIYARVQVGGLAGALGDLDRAEAILSEVFVDAGALGLDEVAVDAANRLIFTVGYRAARHGEGVVWSRAAEMLVRRLDQADEPRGATVLNSVANVYFALGDYARSQRLFEEALAINHRVLGPEHPIVGDNLTNLADVHYALDDYDRALELYGRSLEISAQALGAGHPSRGYAMNNLANVHIARGELERASELLERVLAIFAAAYGADHPELANPTNNLANVHRRRGELERARIGYRRAVDLLEASFGADHLALATPLDNLGTASLLLGDAAAAAQSFARALTIREASLDGSRPEIAESLVHRGRARLALSELRGANEDLARAQAIRAAADPGDDAKTVGVAEVLALRGEVALAEGRDDEGRELLEQAITGLGDAGPKGARGAARFALARALAASDPARARDLADAARRLLAEVPEERRALADIDTWLSGR